MLPNKYKYFLLTKIITKLGYKFKMGILKY